MNTSTAHVGQRDGVQRLAQAAAVLYQAQHELTARPQTDVHGLTLGAVHGLVEDVLDLLPPGVAVRHQVACGEDPVRLLYEAEVLLTRRSITGYPPGTSTVITTLIDTSRGLATRRGLPYPPPELTDE